MIFLPPYPFPQLCFDQILSKTLRLVTNTWPILMTINIILSFICRQRPWIFAFKFLGKYFHFPYYTRKIILFIFHKFLSNICFISLQVLEGKEYLTSAAPWSNILSPSQTFRLVTNIWPTLINNKHHIIFNLQAETTDICLEISRQIFPYYTGKIILLIFPKFLWNICVTSLKVLEGDKIFDQGAAKVKYSSPEGWWYKFLIEIYEK